MFGILKDHEYALVLEHNLTETNDISVVELTAETHLTNSTLRDARVADLLSLLVGLELFDGELADGLAVAADGLVDASIGTRADEADDAVAVCDADLGLISGGAVVRFYTAFLVSVSWETDAKVVRAERHGRGVKCLSLCLGILLEMDEVLLTTWHWHS